MKKIPVILLCITFLLSCPFILKAGEVLVEGDVNLLSANRINEHTFILYSKYRGKDPGKIFLKEFDLDKQQIKKKELGVKGISAYLSYFNDRFYVSYTSLEKEGNARIAEFDLNWNLLRDILVTPTPFDGEIAYQLNPAGDRLYLLYARNWVNDCGLKLVEFNRYLEQIREITLMQGETNFHVHQASSFSAVLANDKFYVAYRKNSPKSMDIFLDKFDLSGKLLSQRCIDRKEKLSPALTFADGIFYLAYEGRKDNLRKTVVYVKKYDQNWDLLGKTEIITQESGAPRKKQLIVSEGRCFLISISQSRASNKIFIKEINFDLKQDRIRL